MSHKQPHRRTPSDTDLRPDHGPYSSSDSRHTSSDHNFYRPPQESQSSSQQSSSSSRVSAQWSQDGALSILSSCGLEPSDLSLLAELPEDVLTVESLPHVLQQMKGRRGTFKHCPPTAPSSSSSYPPGSNLQPAVRDWDQLRSQPVRYPLGQATSFPSEPVQVHWGGSRASRSVRADPPPPSSSSLSSSSLHVAYFHHRPGLSEYGKTSRATSSSSSQDRASFRSTGQRQRSRPSRFSEPGSADHRSAPPHKPQGGHLQPETSPVSQQALTASMPSIKEALDFHGTSPRVHPYSCSLCDITVLSERDWAKHINSTQHADGQLNLLQRCPKWDCRMETVSRANNQSERKDEEEAPWPPQTANQRQKPQLNKQKKASDKGKVVCVKFPAQSVDEAYLRKLIDPFGKIIKILMFPSLAFVELGSVDQAKDLVTFHVNYPPTVNGEQIQFSISSTFHFLQSSRVVSFCPAPTGDDSRSDLISIIKRFGPPLYTLFLPSRAFVEMKNAPDAQKMVDYYSSNILRINSDALKVSFSGEYKSLMHVASAQKYEEGETASTKKEGNQIEEKEMGKDTKRKRNESQEKEMKRRSSSKDRTEQRSSTERRTRSRSRGRSRRDRSMSSRSRDRSSTERRTRSRSRERSSRDRRTKTRSKSREKLKDYGSREEPEKLDSESRTDPEPDPVSEFRPGPAENEQSEEEAESSTYNSDIEGMEVIGEDLEEEEEEEEEEEDVEEDAYRGSSSPAERSDSPEEEKEEEEVKEEGKDGAMEEAKDGEMEEAKEEGKDGAMEEAKEEGKDEEMEEVKEEGKDGAMEEAKEEGKDGAMEEAKEEGKDGAMEEAKEEGKDGAMEEAKEEGKDGAMEEAKEEGKDGAMEEAKEEGKDGEMEDAAEAPEDKEEPGFPVDLENCITLDELAESDSEVGGQPEPPCSRVVYLSNLPQRFYTDAQFVKLVRGFGKVVRYFLVRRRREGFIEMSSSSEALQAAQELSCRPATFHGCKLSVRISHKYHRLINGWDVQSDEEEEKSERRSRGSRRKRSESRSNSRTSDRDETCQPSEGKKELESKRSRAKKSGHRENPEKESTNKNTPEEESITQTTSEESKEQDSLKPPGKESGSKTKPSEDMSVSMERPEEEFTPKSTSQETSRLPLEKETRSKRSKEEELVSRKNPETKSMSGKSGEEQEDDSGPGQKEDLEGEEISGSQESSPDGAECTEDPPEPQTQQKPDSDKHMQDWGLKPGTADPERSTKPVGTEFVRPVVGYFCHLCQVIYADEDEAKVQHCRSPAHYRKYQEKTGIDPWTS